MSIAQDVRMIVTSQDVSTYTLTGGYAVKKSGQKVEFAQWTPVREPKRDDEGRLVHAEGRYQDGSILIYKWTPLHGRKVVVGKEKP
jgi:hypothetical protein